MICEKKWSPSVDIHKRASRTHGWLKFCLKLNPYFSGERKEMHLALERLVLKILPGIY